MAKINFINEQKLIQVKQGNNILVSAIKERISIRHKCGGKGSCTTCKVKIKKQDRVSEPTIIEKKLLGDTQLANGFRLSCQTKVFGDVEVETLEDPLKALIRTQLEALNKHTSEN